MFAMVLYDAWRSGSIRWPYMAVVDVVTILLQTFMWCTSLAPRPHTKKRNIEFCGGPENKASGVLCASC